MPCAACAQLGWRYSVSQDEACAGAGAGVAHGRRVAEGVEIAVVEEQSSVGMCVAAVADFVQGMVDVCKAAKLECNHTAESV